MNINCITLVEVGLGNAMALTWAMVVVVVDSTTNVVVIVAVMVIYLISFFFFLSFFVKTNSIFFLFFLFFKGCDFDLCEACLREFSTTPPPLTLSELALVEADLHSHVLLVMFDIILSLQEM